MDLVAGDEKHGFSCKPRINIVLEVGIPISRTSRTLMASGLRLIRSHSSESAVFQDHNQ